MEEILLQAISWCRPVILLVLIILIGNQKGMRGKIWLIVSISLSFSITLVWKFLRLVSIFDLFDSYIVSSLYDILRIPLSIAGLIALILLIPYVLALSDASDDSDASDNSNNSEKNSANSDDQGYETKPVSIVESLFSFDGRMSRFDYWIKGILIITPLMIINNLFLIATLFNSSEYQESLIILSIIISIAGIWPALALTVKRLHDRNRSGWLVMTLLVPVANIVFSLWLFIETGFLKGSNGANRFEKNSLQFESDFPNIRND